uniref:Uncharacterized protein n=2 Tax=Oryza TaxID=4527 RepID=A0A0E0QS78_ORYRU
MPFTRRKTTTTSCTTSRRQIVFSLGFMFHVCSSADCSLLVRCILTLHFQKNLQICNCSSTTNHMLS